MEQNKPIRVCSFNIQHSRNFITGEIDIPLMARTVEKMSADIVALEEVYGMGEGEIFCGQAEKIAGLLGYNAFFAPAIQLSKGPYGNAIISRFPIKSERVFPVPPAVRQPGRYFEDRCAAKATIITPHGELDVIGIHFGLQPEEAELCVRTVIEITPKDRPCVLMGDFNLTPEDPILDPIRAEYKDTDEYFKGGDNYTFPSDKPVKKIDYIFTKGGLTVTKVDIPRLIAADHLPVIADITINKGERS